MYKAAPQTLTFAQVSHIFRRALTYLVEPCPDPPLPLLVEVLVRQHVVVLHHLATLKLPSPSKQTDPGH